jgi:hypothetical protein
MLQDIERAGLFVVPLDEVRGWWSGTTLRCSDAASARH